MRRAVWLLILLFCLCCFSAYGESAVEIYQAPKQIVITFVGDCTLGNSPVERKYATGFESYIAKNGYEYPFAKVKEYFEQDDLTVINLEGVFHDDESDLVKKKNVYNFRAPTGFAQILPLSSIEAASIGNNHALDYGEAGEQSTIQALESLGIGWFGCDEYVTKTYIYEKDGIKIGFVSAYISWWWGQGNGTLLKQCLQDLRAEGCAVIIGCMHGGVEYDIRHDLRQEQFADAMIRNGADIVIGHHPHTIQGIRVENGRTTLWSLGNFCFGGNSEIKKNAAGALNINTYIAQFTFSFDEDGTYLGHQLNIIPCQVSGSKEFNDYQPHPVTGREADNVIAAIQKDVKKIKLKPFVEGMGALQEFVPAPSK